MENHHVQVKRSKYRKDDNPSPAVEAQRAKWRAQKLKRYHSGNLSDTNSKARLDKEHEQLIEMMGGKCAITGETENLHFHHIKPSTKSFDIGYGIWRRQGPFEDYVKEAKKCVLITRTEHTKIHTKVNQRLREILSETDLTPKALEYFKDYYTDRYTRQAIAIAQIQAI